MEVNHHQTDLKKIANEKYGIRYHDFVKWLVRPNMALSKARRKFKKLGD